MQIPLFFTGFYSLFVSFKILFLNFNQFIAHLSIVFYNSTQQCADYKQFIYLNVQWFPK
jgi:hypothetical protein